MTFRCRLRRGCIRFSEKRIKPARAFCSRLITLYLRAFVALRIDVLDFRIDFAAIFFMTYFDVAPIADQTFPVVEL